MLDSWRDHAVCVNISTEEQDFFFSEDEIEIAMAQSICASCQVTDECLQYAIETSQPAGVYGMHTERDRRTLKRFLTLKPHEAQKSWDHSFEKVEARMRARLAVYFETA